MRAFTVVLLLASSARAEPLLAERLIEMAASDRRQLEIAALAAAEIGATALARKLLSEAERTAAKTAYGWAELGDLAELEKLRARIETLWEAQKVDEVHRCLDRNLLAEAFERAGKTDVADALDAPCKGNNLWRRLNAALARADLARVRALTADRDVGSTQLSRAVKVLLDAGDREGARVRVERAVRRLDETARDRSDQAVSPGNVLAEPVVALGELRRMLGDHDAALALARRAQGLHRVSVMTVPVAADIADLFARAGEPAAADEQWRLIGKAGMAPWALAKVYAEHGRVAEARTQIAAAERQLTTLGKSTHTTTAQAARSRAMEQRTFDPLIPHAVFEGGHQMLSLACAAIGDFSCALRHLLDVPSVPVSRMGHHPIFEVARKAHAANVRATPGMQPLLARLAAHIAARE
jgi:tetratricopeptide (TPR) repeat protein